jgi:hypothetical protein
MQNVGTPRFYVDTISWLKAIGIGAVLGESDVGTDDSGDPGADIWGSNPTTPFIGAAGGGDKYFKYAYNMGDGLNLPYNFVAFLGHKLADDNNLMNGIGFYLYSDGDMISPNVVNSVNFVSTNTGYPSLGLPQYDGFSIAMMDSSLDTVEGVGVWAWSRVSPQYQIGKVIAGNYYDMPHSPDLNLKLSYEYDGVKNIQTKGGATLSNASYTKPADWGDRGAWQLGSDEGGQGISNIRSGRRVWDLSFSYLSDTDIMPANASTANFSGNENDNFKTNILDGTDFFSVVWNRTMGGHLPFIFQPDGPKYNASGTQIAGNNNPDQFAICRFVGNSLQYEQVANNVYNVKLKIRESW